MDISSVSSIVFRPNLYTNKQEDKSVRHLVLIRVAVEETWDTRTYLPHPPPVFLPRFIENYFLKLILELLPSFLTQILHLVIGEISCPTDRDPRIGVLKLVPDEGRERV